MARTYVIVGSGIAGLSAAETIRRRDDRATIRLISEEAHPFYSRPGLAYLLRGDIPDSRLVIRPPEEVKRLRLQRIHARAVELRTDIQELTLDTGQRIDYSALLLATGATAVPPPFYSGTLQGLVKIDSLDDTRSILKQARRGRIAVVVGGGITALELVEGLAARGMEVHYFLRSDRYWADVLDEVESRIVLDRLRHEGVVVHLRTQVKELLQARGQVVGVVTESGQQLACQMVGVAIGVRPRLELARQAGLQIDRGVVVSVLLQTSAPNVYAAGDVAQVYDHNARTTLPMDVLWPTALEQGRIAGANMTGEAAVYSKGVAFNVTQLAGLAVTLIGSVGQGKGQDLLAIARGDSESWRRANSNASLASAEGVNRVRLLLGERTLVGAVVLGEQTWSRPLQKLIGEQADISPIRDRLIRGDHEAFDQLALFYHRWSQGVGR